MSTEADELLARIRELSPLLQRNAAAGELDRRVSQESIDALTEAGAFRVSSPKRYGGLDLSYKDAMHVGRQVGMADGGTAWVVSIINSCVWYVRLFSEQAQDEVFATGPDTRVSAVVEASGSARKVDGGYRVTGKWYYNSGGWHSDWVIVACTILGEDGEERGEGILVLPAGDYEIVDVWHVAGMKSSGSNCIAIDDVFVPEHRAVVSSMFKIGSDDAESDAANGRSDAPAEPAYRAASQPLALLGPQLGMGRAVLERVIEQAHAKRIAYTAIERHSESVTFQVDVAKAAQLLDAADLFADRAADDLDTVAALGRPLDYVRRARVRADVGCAVQNVSRAIDLLLTAHGSSGFAESSPIQRHWRDQAIVARHGYVSTPLSLEIYGKALLGVDNVRGAIL